MRMRRGNYVRPGMVNARMDRERGNVHRVLAFDDFAFSVHQDQVSDADMSEMHTEGIDPEMIRSFRISRGNVPGHTFIKTELGKETEGRGQAFFAVSSFLFHGCELRNGGDFENTRGCGAHITPRTKIRRIITLRRLFGLQEESFILISVMDPFSIHAETAANVHDRYRLCCRPISAGLETNSSKLDRLVCQFGDKRRMRADSLLWDGCWKPRAWASNRCCVDPLRPQMFLGTCAGRVT